MLYKNYEAGEPVLLLFGAGDKPIHGKFLEAMDDDRAVIELNLVPIHPETKMPNGKCKFYCAWHYLRPVSGYKG